MIYEYRCGHCEKIQEVWQKMSDPAPKACSLCHSEGPLERVISATSFALKGTGWYTTDYKRSGAPAETSNVSNASAVASSSEVTGTAKAPPVASEAIPKKTESKE
jgi:putative FmdB family regulatory protein